MRKKMEFETKISIVASVMSIVTGLLFGFYIMLLLDKNAALIGMNILFTGVFRRGFTGLADLLLYSVPIIMTGLSVGLGFKCGLFNIGASGQFTVGAFAAILVGVRCSFLPPVIHCLAAVIAAGIAGGLWGLLPGLLKAFRNVNEVISTLLLNYVALYLVNYLIQLLVYDSGNNQTLPVPATAQLLSLSIGDAKINIGIIIAVVVALMQHFVLEKTTFGYELKVCGRNRFASMYSGMKEKRLIIQSMVLAGMLSGLGGALLYLSGQGVFLPVSEAVLSHGFDGLSVALIAMSSPIAIIVVALFLGYINVGGNIIQLVGFSPEVVNMIVAAIVYCGALIVPYKKIARLIFKKIEKGGAEE